MKCRLPPAELHNICLETLLCTAEASLLQRFDYSSALCKALYGFTTTVAINPNKAEKENLTTGCTNF